MALSPGDRLRALVVIGDGQHALDFGAQCTVAEITQPGVSGVETSAEPVVILEHAYTAPVLRDGEWVEVPHVRRLAFPESRIPQYFEPYEEHS